MNGKFVFACNDFFNFLFSLIFVLLLTNGYNRNFAFILSENKTSDWMNECTGDSRKSVFLCISNNIYDPHHRHSQSSLLLFSLFLFVFLFMNFYVWCWHFSVSVLCAFVFVQKRTYIVYRIVLACTWT